MHVSCKNRGIVELDLQSVFANDEERGALAVVKSLDLSHNELVRIGGLQPFSSLVGLDLSFNKLLQLQGLPLGLVRLNVSNNGLSSLDGLAALPYLQELDATHNKLTTLQGLQRNSPLAVLKLAHNRLTSARGVEHLAHLATVELDNNFIRSYDDLCPLTHCDALRSLTLAHNPITDDPTCRRTVTNMLKGLTSLDGTGVSKVLHTEQRASRPSTPEMKPLATSSALRGRPAHSALKAAASERGTPPQRSGTNMTPVVTPVRQGTRGGPPAAASGPRWARSSTPPAAMGGVPSRMGTPAQGDRDVPSGASTPRMTTPGLHGDSSVINQSLPLTFDGVKQRAEQRTAEMSQVKTRVASEATELRSMLDDETQLSTTLQQRNRKLTDDLAAAKGALGEELEQIAMWKEELVACQGELKATQLQNEKLYKINRHLELKLKEEKERRMAELEKIKATHNAVVESLKVRIQESADAVRAAQDAEGQWLEEKAKLQEYVAILERENGQIASKLSKFENAHADAPHLYQTAAGGVGPSQGSVKLTWSPQKSLPARPSAAFPGQPAGTPSAPSPVPHSAARGASFPPVTDSPAGGGLSGPSTKPMAQRLGSAQHGGTAAGQADTQRLIQLSRMANAGTTGPNAEAAAAASPAAAPTPPQTGAVGAGQLHTSPRPPSAVPTPTRRAGEEAVDVHRGGSVASHARGAAAGSSTHGVLAGQGAPQRMSMPRESPRHTGSLARQDDLAVGHPGAFSEVASSVASERTETTKNALEFAVQLKKWLLTEMDKKSPSKQHLPHPGVLQQKMQGDVTAMWARGDVSLDSDMLVTHHQSP